MSCPFPFLLGLFEYFGSNDFSIVDFINYFFRLTHLGNVLRLRQSPTVDCKWYK